MNRETIAGIVEELRSKLAGRFLGKIYQLTAFSLAIDFGLRAEGCLFIGAEPSTPRIHLIRRRTRELEQVSIPLSTFAQGVRAHLAGARLAAVSKYDQERIVRLSFAVVEETGEAHGSVLVAQLTGRSANMFLLDDQERITHTLRPPRGEGQQIGERYRPPESQSQPISAERALEKEGYDSLSAAADDYYRRLERTEAFAARFKALRSRIQQELAQGAKLKSNLTRDLATHGDPEAHKRIGDLLLANIASARRDGNMLSVVDYYSEGTPIIKLEVDENTSLQDEASQYFARYSKAKRARGEIAARLVKLEDETTRLQEKLAELRGIVDRRDEAALDAFEAANRRTTTRQVKQKDSEKIPGVRRYRSSDDYEVLVGRAARDNDYLTFRIARPHDLWLHAADYPGSHVIIRSHNRNEIPYLTIIEAAQLAAKFSQASNDSKVTVHYTQRKFLSKPKGAAPGVVRMSSFKTITVEPKEVIERS